MAEHIRRLRQRERDGFPSIQFVGEATVAIGAVAVLAMAAQELTR